MQEKALLRHHHLLLDALPALWKSRVALAFVLVALGKLAVRAFKLNTKSLCVVDKFSTDNSLRRVTILYPIHQSHEDVVLGVIAIDFALVLSNGMRTNSSCAVAGSADDEVAVERVLVAWFYAHVHSTERCFHSR